MLADFSLASSSSSRSRCRFSILVESRVTGAELVADALDGRPYVRPKAIRAAPGDEALEVQAVIERAVGHKRAGVRHQQMDELVFAEREVDIDTVPEGAAGFRLQTGACRTRGAPRAQRRPWA